MGCLIIHRYEKNFCKNTRHFLCYVFTIEFPRYLYALSYFSYFVGYKQLIQDATNGSKDSIFEIVFEMKKSSMFKRDFFYFELIN